MAGTIVCDTIQDGAGNSTATDNAIYGSAKAWAYWTGSTGTINGSYNVSSVTRTSTGSYTVNFTNAFANANYATCFSASVNGSINYWGISEANAQTASAAYVRAYNNSAPYDPVYCNASFFHV